ncbi:thymidylate synthase [Spirochaetota bacterium]|nr:thymidylate synthase [Spirochaetota bacterium]
MQAYLDLIEKTLTQGTLIENRTATAAYTMLGGLIEHDMQKGYPLLTTKKMPFRTIATELEFFIKGRTDKKWLQERHCHIWDEWCNPKKVAHIEARDERIARQRKEDDLGPIYGKQWRSFTSTPTPPAQNPHSSTPNQNSPVAIDQLQNLITELQKNPNSRRLLVSAWNPLDLPEMALPPCHVLFQVTVIEKTLSLTWFQRSADLMLGIPFNIASYALLLHLLAKESGYTEGKLIGMLSNIHIYENHRLAAEQQLERTPKPLPKITTPHFTSIFNWSYPDTHLQHYTHHPKIKLPIAI